MGTWSSLVALAVKNLPAVWETQVRSLSLEDPPEEGNGNPLQYSCLENPMDKGAWRAIVHGVTKESDTTEQLIQTHRVLVDLQYCVSFRHTAK